MDWKLWEMLKIMQAQEERINGTTPAGIAPSHTDEITEIVVDDDE